MDKLLENGTHEQDIYYTISILINNINIRYSDPNSSEN